MMTTAPKLEDPEQTQADLHAQPMAAENVHRVLEEIFKCVPFRASRQSQDLLRYIVTHTLSGEDQLLRERVIGAEVFGRKPDYDTGEDPVVRLRASDVRKRLAQVYQSEYGAALPIKIEIPAGSYRANIERNQRPHKRSSPAITAEPETPAIAASPADPLTGRQAPRSHRNSWIVALLAIAFLFAVIAGVVLRNRANKGLEAFWGPMLRDPHPTLICVGSNAVYRLSNEFLRNYEKTHGEDHHGFEFLIRPEPGKQLDQRDLLRAPDFVALGDVSATSSIVSFLTRSDKKFNERFPQDMSFAEVQENPSILIGGFNNNMAMTINKSLRFTLDGSDSIKDRNDPKQSWRLPFYMDAKDTEDYALVSRLVDPSTGHQTVTLGGIGQFGTQAAADFLTNPRAMAEWTKTLPANWRYKNVQFVLHVKIIDYRPVSTEVVLSHVW